MKSDFLNKLKSYTVLYAEDEDGIRSNIEEILKHLFKEVYSAKNLSEAYTLYTKNSPDLIITDIKMGNETGIDLIKNIRKLSKKTRVIITSAFTDVDYLLKATELHLIKYIVKPITYEKLLEALELFINSYNKPQIQTLTVEWIFDTSKAIVSNSKEEFSLTKRENNFLNLLLEKDRIITYEELEVNIWDEDLVMTPNAMRLFIKNFRKKLPKNFLKNIQGVGYKLVRD